MSIMDIAVVFVAVIAIVVAYQLSGIRSEIHRATGLLQSLDHELFHIAQEQNPQYGICSRCGRRAVVRHVLPRDGEPESELARYVLLPTMLVVIQYCARRRRREVLQGSVNQGGRHCGKHRSGLGPSIKRRR